MTRNELWQVRAIIRAMELERKYADRVRELEYTDGMTTSDAQAVADAEFIKEYGFTV